MSMLHTYIWICDIIHCIINYYCATHFQITSRYACWNSDLARHNNRVNSRVNKFNTLAGKKERNLAVNKKGFKNKFLQAQHYERCCTVLRT